MHEATGVISCASDTEAIMEVTVNDGTTVSIPVRRECGAWLPVDPVPLFGEDGASPALHYVVPGFGDTPSQVIVRGEDFSFDHSELWNAFTGLDERVVDQTRPGLQWNSSADSLSFSWYHIVDIAVIAMFDGNSGELVVLPLRSKGKFFVGSHFH